MKRIMLLIVGLIVIIGALTFFTYSVDTMAQEAPSVAQAAANQPGTPDTQSTTTPVTSETGTVATPAVENSAPETVMPAPAPVEIPVPKAPATRNPSNPGSEQAADYAKMTEQPTSQTFDESMGIKRSKPTTPVAAESHMPETPEIPEEIEPAKSEGVPSCMMLCDKVCNTLKDETDKLVEE